MIEIPCPLCGSVEWNAIEQFTALTPCRLLRGESVEVEFDSRAELARDAATSVTTMYVCGTDECRFTIEPSKLNEQGGVA